MILMYVRYLGSFLGRLVGRLVGARLVVRSVGWLVGLGCFVSYSLHKGGKLHFHAPIVSFVIFPEQRTEKGYITLGMSKRR